MNTIDDSFEAMIEVKQSKFIAYLVPMLQFDGMQDSLRQKHPKSRHVVYSLRYYNKYRQIVENSSDDGEPKGSSGVPALNVLRGNVMIECAVLIVRYFGGTKLGIGGLVRAYTEVTKAVIEISNIKKYEYLNTFSYSTDYSSVQRVEYLLKQLDISDISKEFGTGVLWQIKTVEEKIEEFKKLAGRTINIL